MNTIIDKINYINLLVNSYVWSTPSLILILCVGLYLTIKLNFIQLTKFTYVIKKTIGKTFKSKKNDNEGITPFQSLCTALAGTIGTGNMAGVAGAIALGGPGAVFWMWISSILGMAIKFVEVSLAIIFREINNEGEYVGGPMYYIKNGLGKKWLILSYFFAICCILASFGMGNAVQVNTITTSIQSILNMYNISYNLKFLKLLIGITLTTSVAVILIGGIKRLAKVCEKIIPLMSILYITLSIGVIIINIDYLPLAFSQIIKGAFNPKSITCGVVSSIFMTVGKGMSRGVFSNEAGLGSASIAHCSSSEKSPVIQGFWGIFEVFFDTIVICSLSAFVIICGLKGNITYGKDLGIFLTLSGFVNVYGKWITIPITISLISFAISTILGWGFYGVRSFEYVFGQKFVKVYLLIFSLVCIMGAMGSLSFVWNISDTINGLMMIPNLISIILLSPYAIRETKHYFKELKNENKFI